MSGPTKTSHHQELERNFSNSDDQALADIDRFIRKRCELKNYSCKSLIITVFGDLISPHGGWIWLGSLIEALEPLGYSERLVRTSVFMLVQDNWLQVEKVGRKSYYAFTASALQHYINAARRIYSDDESSNDEKWLLVVPSFVPESQMQSFKRQLRWQGFSSLAAGVLAHPSYDYERLSQWLVENQLNDKVVVMQSVVLDQHSQQTLKKLVEDRWQIENLESDYREFSECYSELVDKLDNNYKTLSGKTQLALRTLLIHEYRRILLRDHELPKSMLPEDWFGQQASTIIKKLYLQLANASEQYAIGKFENQHGLLPRADNSYLKRFQ